MTISEKYIEFLQEEKELLIKQEIENKTLSDDEKIAKGFLITDCKLTQLNGDKVFFICNDNNSKFKMGDSVIVTNSMSKEISCKIIENCDNEIIIESKNKTFFKQTDIYQISGTTFNQHDILIELLQKIVRGAPGYSFLQYLDVTNQSIIFPSLQNEKLALSSDIIDKYTANLDSTNKRIISQVLQKPSVFCIQGPPGTGKTTTLATIANILYQEKTSILILANTHQAVNNALSRIKNLNKDAVVIKIGQPLKNENLDTNCIPIERDYNSYRKRMEKNNKSYKKQKEIIGMTMATALVQMGKKTSNYYPEVLLIDEASQITLPASSVLGLYKAPCIIFFGDDKQMPPIFTLEKSPFNISVFEYLKNKYPNNCMILDKSYRLNESICSLINEYFYTEGRLEKLFISKNIKQFSINIGLIREPKLKKIFDSKESLFCIVNEDTLSQDRNLVEVNEIVNLVKGLKTCDIKDNQFCIVTPYRRQVKEIRNGISNIYEKNPIVDTVERVQGIDTDLVICSICSSEIKWIKQFEDFLFNKNRINVMLSRARYKIIILCSENILKFENYFSDMIKQRFIMV